MAHCFTDTVPVHPHYYYYYYYYYYYNYGGREISHPLKANNNNNIIMLAVPACTVVTQNISYLLLAHDNISINKNVVEEEKLPRFRLFATHLGQNAFANEKTIGNSKWLKQHKNTDNAGLCSEQNSNKHVGLHQKCQRSKIIEISITSTVRQFLQHMQNNNQSSSCSVAKICGITLMFTTLLVI